MSIQPDQIKKLHTLFRAAGITDEETRRDMISQYSDKGVRSSKQLTYGEAWALINKLEELARKFDPLDAQRKKMLHYAYKMGRTLADGTVDVDWVDDWCQKYGTIKKPLNDYTKQEMPAIVTQFERVYKSFLKDSIRKR